jgi:hypothetical protein
MTAGLAVFMLVYCTTDDTLTTLGAWQTAAGVTASGANTMAIYDITGATRLGITGDMSVAMASAGWVEGTLTGSVAITAGSSYYIHYLSHFSGTTPKLAAGGGTLFDHLPINGKRPTVYLSAQTTSPTSFTPGSATNNTAEYFLGAR